MLDIYSYLKQHNIAYTEYEHPAVFTCAESEELTPPMPGSDTKNLFLKDDKNEQFFIVTVPHTKRVDLKLLAKVLQVRKLRFASEDELMLYLGVTPGSVTILGLMHDIDHRVSCIIDESIWNSVAIQCHPLINTATVVISHQGLESFLRATGHIAHVVDVPSIV